MKLGKKPNPIPAGIGMTVLGLIFLFVMEQFPLINIPLSAAYAVAGVVVLVKGIKARRSGSNQEIMAQSDGDDPEIEVQSGRSNQAKKAKDPISKKIFRGIFLFVGGLIVTIALFCIYPVLMGVGHVMVVIGMMIFVKGLSERKKRKASSLQEGGTHSLDATTSQANSSSRSTAQPAMQKKREYCARCGKDITALSAGQFVFIKGAKYCMDCKTAIEQEQQQKQNMICSVCGTKVPIEDMHVIDDALLCHECFLKKYSNTELYAEEVPGAAVDERSVKILSQKIIAEITKNPSDHYQLASLLWTDAAECFPQDYFQWDGAWFNLDLRTGKLFAKVSTYPNQFGASYEDTIFLSVAEFARIAKKYNMAKELQDFKTEEDWAKLIDDSLKRAISHARVELQKQEEERQKREQQWYAVKIPKDFAQRKPSMDITEVVLEISQRYASRSVKVTVEKETYHILYVNNSHLSSCVDRYERTLTPAQAAWLERQIQNTIKNPDNSTWQSLPGGDTMSIAIRQRKGKSVELHGGLPIRKYSDLMSELENLAQYGSR
ncbi:MAG: hypothetical protein IJX08_01020 [Clostridia bacterium]|nr:hypothetical protein [Clostridia bacterium]